MNEFEVTIGCVYNSIEDYQAMVKSIVRMEGINNLKKVQFLGVYNSNNSRFSSPRKALSYLISVAKGKYFAFVHQDVEFLSQNPISKLLYYLKNIPDVGVIGVAGVNSLKSEGFIVDGKTLFGNPFSLPKSVDSVDELFFAIEKKEFENFSFIDHYGWHAYSIELCMYAKLNKLNNYVIPITVIHKSVGFNRKDLSSILKQLERKYSSILPFYTTVGTLGVKSNNLKFLVKDSLIKNNLKIYHLAVRSHAILLSKILRLFPFKNVKHINKNYLANLIFLLRNANKHESINFVHVIQSIDGNKEFEDIKIRTRSISNIIDIPQNGEVNHVFCNPARAEKIILEFSKSKTATLIENYNLLDNFDKICNDGKIALISKFAYLEFEEEY
ncbi:MAG: glycosyltransferase family protein [Thermotogae bacterium]|jgi:hypothetical protein|nr:glycosyltransferase family protein [Thermotogota bacterium]MCL5031903.1 glycosyltransferase family protein [Thermotogota bacterium]